MRAQSGRLTALPGPDDDLDGDDIDGGVILADDDADGEEFDPDVPEWVGETETPAEPERTAPPRDKAPGPGARPKPGRSSKSDQTGRKSSSPARVTQAVRKDVHAKISFMLTMGGAAWEMRDQPCGGTFLHQEPAITSALAKIVCDSPDLLVWFTTGGNYIKWLDLAMALLPVGQCAWSHHVQHQQMVPADPNLPPQHPADASQAFAA